MTDLSSTEKHLDQGYVLLRYEGVYDSHLINLDCLVPLATATLEEVLNLRALVIDLTAVSEITMADSDVYTHQYVYGEMKLLLDALDVDIGEIVKNTQRLTVCPTHLRKAWLERMEIIQLAPGWHQLSEVVFFDTIEAAVAAVNPV